jgi:hypothetical protein
MKPSELFEALHALITERVPLHIWGACGVGKSQIVAQVASDLGWQFLDIRAVQLDPVDLRGLPRISADQAEWVPPKFLPTSGEGILFLDELTAAHQMTQAGCYQLVLDRLCGAFSYVAFNKSTGPCQAASVTVDGKVFMEGDVDYVFSMQSISKVFTLALAMQQRGAEMIFKDIGTEPTGRPFNSIAAVEDSPGRTGNPFVNPGAIATTSLITGATVEDKWQSIFDLQQSCRRKALSYPGCLRIRSCHQQAQQINIHASLKL